jgi:hypothetical protein
MTTVPPHPPNPVKQGHWVSANQVLAVPAFVTVEIVVIRHHPLERTTQTQLVRCAEESDGNRSKRVA